MELSSINEMAKAMGKINLGEGRTSEHVEFNIRYQKEMSIQHLDLVLAWSSEGRSRLEIYKWDSPACM